LQDIILLTTLERRLLLAYCKGEVLSAKKEKTTALNIGAENEPLQLLGFCNLYQVVDFIQMVMILIGLGGYMYQKTHDD